jgi:hypothetical protein
LLLTLPTPQRYPNKSLVHNIEQASYHAGIEQVVIVGGDLWA